MTEPGREQRATVPGSAASGNSGFLEQHGSVLALGILGLAVILRVSGITEWWLRRQRIEETVLRVYAALEFLEERGFVVRSNGRFEVNAERIVEIDRWLRTLAARADPLEHCRNSSNRRPPAPPPGHRDI